MSTSSSAPPTPEGPGSASGAPNLPAGFTDTFTSRYVDTGELRQHAVIIRAYLGGNLGFDLLGIGAPITDLYEGILCLEGRGRGRSA